MCLKEELYPWVHIWHMYQLLPNKTSTCQVPEFMSLIVNITSLCMLRQMYHFLKFPSYLLPVVVVLCFSWLSCFSCESDINEPFLITASSPYYPDIRLSPFQRQYIRVDLPPGFASLSINVESNVDVDEWTVNYLPRNELPVICVGNGSPPLPDVSNTSLTVLSPLTNDSFADILARRLVQHCYPLQENIMLMLTNEQISSGVWFIGLFNGIGYTETQSKMIIGGSDLSVRVDINVEGCPGSPNSRMWGQYCKQTVLPILCAKPAVYMNNQTAEKVTTCRNSLEPCSMGCRAPRGYSLDVTAIVEKLKIIAVDVRLKKRFSVYLAENFSGILYARYGAMPSSSLYDYSVHIRKFPLVIQSPKIGTWYFSLLPGNQTKGQGVLGDKDIFTDLCYSLVWQKIECPVGKTGPHCAWESYMLKPAVGESSSESYNPSIGQKLLLEPFLSNSSLGDKLGFAWTYFLIDLPHGRAGGNIHLQLYSRAILDYEIYSRFGALPSLETWDCYYGNKTISSNGSVLYKLYNSSEKTVSFYILHAKEGIWSFGLRYPVRVDGSYKVQTVMFISTERCPQGCSSHGTCENNLDGHASTLYSYCSCGPDHGGFDCSIEILSQVQNGEFY